MLRIRDVYPGSSIRMLSIPDPNFFHPGPGSPSNNLSIITQKKVSKLSEIWSRLIFLPILDPGSRGHKGTGSRIRIRNTATKVSFYWLTSGPSSGQKPWRDVVWPPASPPWWRPPWSPSAGWGCSTLAPPPYTKRRWSTLIRVLQILQGFFFKAYNNK